MMFWYIKLRKENADLRRENTRLLEENQTLRARRVTLHATAHAHPTKIFFGALELRHGVPVHWQHNPLLMMGADEQYASNVENGYDMPPRHA